MPEADISSRRGVDGKRIEAFLIRGGVGLLVAVATIFLVAIGVLASAAATGNETLFDFMAWLIPLMGVVCLVLALGGTIVVRRMMKDQASGVGSTKTDEDDKETTTVGTRDVAGQPTDQAGQVAGEVEATYAARREARKRGVDLTKVKGTGSDGRIVVRDVVGAPSEAAQQAQDTAGGADQQAQDIAGQETAGEAARQPQESPKGTTQPAQGAGGGPATLSVLKLNDPYGAERLLVALLGMQEQGMITLEDAAVVSWLQGNKRPKTRQLHSTAGAGAGWGAFWGFLMGLIFFMPLLEEEIGVEMRGMTGALADVGIDDDFIKLVREKVTPGTSALFALTSGATAPDKVIDELKQYDFEIISTNLPQEQLRETFIEA